jgi:vancomycin resistance protein YoaR
VRSSRLALVLSVGALAGIGGGLLAHRYVPESPVVRGLYIGDGRVPDRPASIAAWLTARREAARRRTVRFHHEGRIFEATLEQAGVSIDVAATLAAAQPIGHRGSAMARLREAERARRGQIDVPIVWTVDEARARALLATYAEAVARAPVDARLDLAQHLRIPDVSGRELDVDGSLAALVAGTHDDDEKIELAVRYVPAKVTVVDLARVEVEKVVAAFETTFVLFGTGAGRAINIANAASRFDGTVLAPGEVFSFNDAVGPRTRERGFALAPEIQGDELQNGYGGGTCQASSTLHAAALYAALGIVERQPHSRPSSYTKMGLDATVSYPLTDLKIKNTLPYPIMIHAFLPKPTAVRVEILGGEPVAKVDYTYGVGHTEDFIRRVTVKAGTPPGKVIRHQKGIQGFDVFSIVKVTYLADGRSEERHYYSGYRPTPEILYVAPGFDGEMPPLPAHAKGVEGAAPDEGSGATAQAGVGG